MTDRTDLAAAIQSTLIDGELTAIEPHLAANVLWGECHSSSMVMDTLREVMGAGIEVASGSVETMADRFAVDLQANISGELQTFSFAVFDEAGKLTEINGPTGSDDARTRAPIGRIERAGSGAEFAGVAPVLPVSNLKASAEVYRRAGFTVEMYGGDADYGYASRGRANLHLTQVPNLDPKTTTSAVYLFVSDARELYAEWRDADLGGRLHPPTDTDYGLCEGAWLDADNNLLRFGSDIS